MKFIHTRVYKNRKIYKCRIIRDCMLLSKKAIIEINEQFDNGHVINANSLNYIIEEARKSENWLKSLAIVVRGILIDHIFEEGNKRTTAAVIATWLDMENLYYNKDKINDLIIKILKKNITNLNEIMGLIKNAIQTTG